MKFNKYNSLTNHDVTKFINLVVMNDLSAGEFVATEKAHGANFGLHFNGTEYRSSKRSGINGVDENFHGSVKIAADYEQCVAALYNYIWLVHKLEDGFDLAIRGEVIGGMYKGVQANHASRVQKEVEYSINNEFIVFDIEINGEPVSYNAFESLCMKFSFTQCPELKRGTLQELLAMNNEFDSVIPALYGNENFEGNTTEGFVIRPVYGERFLPNGTRVIIKSKNSKFKENGGKKVRKSAVHLTDGEHAIGEQLTTYFTEQRISNVLSKHPVIQGWKDFPKLAGLFFQDALEDFESMEPVAIKDVLGDNWKPFVGVYKAVSDSMLREVFKQKL
jgi:Rnl2 family RNA ligase